MIEYRCLPATELTREEWSHWSAVQLADPSLHSPWFRPELVRLTASVRKDVEVVVMSDRGGRVGFFPFQRGRHGKAQAVVGRLSEFHGAVCPAGLLWSPKDLCRACGITSWHFDHVPASQVAFNPYVWGKALSPYIDLASGYGEYRLDKKRSGSRLEEVDRKSRKLERECGPLRFEFHSQDPEVFSSLLEWKSAQYRRSKILQVFRFPWVVSLLEAVRACDAELWGGPLSALYAGDQLVAVNMGLRSRSALHVWFPAYNLAYSRYSPRLILLLRLAEASAERGIRRIDLGTGNERYKAEFKTGDSVIAESSVGRRSHSARMHGAWYGAKRRIQRSRWRPQLEIPLVLTRRMRQWLRFH